MEENNKYIEKLDDIVVKLPEACKPFLLETGTEMAVSTRYSYATELKWFFKFLIDEIPEFDSIYNVSEITISDIKKITSQDISRYLSKDKDKGNAERTIARRRSAISKFFSYLMDNQIVGYNPAQAASKVKIHKQEEVVYIDILEQQRLIAAIDNGCVLSKKARTVQKEGFGTYKPVPGHGNPNIRALQNRCKRHRF